MIGELVRLYDRLLETGQAPRYGYSIENVPQGLDISDDGAIIHVIPFGTLTENKQFRHTMPVPAHVLRQSLKVQANFLCDNSSYMLGADANGMTGKAAKRFAAAAELHRQVLANTDDPDARSVLAFFSRGPQAVVVEQKLGTKDWKKTLTGNFVLCRDGRPLSESPTMQRYWDSYFSSGEEDGDDLDMGSRTMQSVVSGKSVIPALTHPRIRGVRNAQSSGAALVTFNAPAYLSYNKKQDQNAPMSKREAFAYTTALNTLLRDDQYSKTVNDGSLTIVSWAESGQAEYSAEMNMCIEGTAGVDQQDLIATVTALSKGDPVDFNGVRLNPDEHFYILGLAPNAARLSVSFFLKDTYGSYMEHVRQHYADLDIERPKCDKRRDLPVWMLLAQTVPSATAGKKRIPASHHIVSDLFKAILTGVPYPTSLLTAVENRICVEHDVPRAKAAIIKAYFLRHPNNQCPKEVLQVSINKESTNVPYGLGRLFALYEDIQHAANPRINTTIGDRFFTNASTMPAVVFPHLGDLAKKHLRKLPTGTRIYYTKRIADLMTRIGENFPTRLSLPEQGAFQLGYYFETQERYKGKNKDDIQETNKEEGIVNE